MCSMKEIKLTQGKSAFIDTADFLAISKHKWCAVLVNKRYWYAVCSIKRRHIYMHRFLLPCASKTDSVDHKNGDGLDNRRKNLRLSNKSQNAANSVKIAKFSSKYKGVSWRKKEKRWIAAIRFNLKRKQLGSFSSEKDAALAYNEAAIKCFGEFARLNVV